MRRKNKTKRKKSLIYKLLSVPLRFKITIPYLVVASLLAGLATYQVGSSYLSTLEARFKAQLADASARVAERVVDIEESHLQMARTIAFTLGVPDAIEQNDINALRELVSPTVYNHNLWFVDILDGEGVPIYTLHRKDGQLEYIENETADYSSWVVVRKVLVGEQDEEGDKFIDIVDTPWGKVLYTSSPIKTEDNIIGVVLIGTPLDAVASILAQKSIVDVSIYAPDGIALSSTLGIEAMPPISQSLYEKIFTVSDILTREVNINNRGYLEAMKPLILRGEQTPWVLGTILPRALVDQPGSTSVYKLVGIFVVGFLALILLGIVIAHLISKPIFALVDASQRVSEGDMNVYVEPIANDEIGLLTHRFNRMVIALRQREFISEMFGRMVSKDVREAVLKNKVALVGETKNVAVLFTDVRGFTTISEKTSPKEVITLLNDFFSIVTKVTAKHEGIINHFGGDSVLAVFGAPISKPLDVSLKQAILAACDIQKGVLELNAKRVAAGLAPLRFGLGINSGTVVAGNIGSEDRFEYTVIGDVVNVAARLQGISRQFPQSPLLIPASAVNSVRDNLPVEFDYLGEFRLKGKEQPIPAYAILGLNKGVPQSFDLFDHYDYPRSIAFHAIYLACLGYSKDVIVEVLLVEEEVVDSWIKKVSGHEDVIGRILAESYSLSPEKLACLDAFRNIVSEEEDNEHESAS